MKLWNMMALSVLLAGCGCAGGKDDDVSRTDNSEPQVKVSVMSYNMLFEHNVPEEPERRWVSRCPNIIATVNAVRPDVIGSQELQSYQVADIVAGTGYKRLGQSLSGTVSDTDNSENECIFYNPDRVDCLESGDFWFSGTPDKPSAGDGMSYNRKCTWARFREKESGSVFYVFNSHFYYEPDKAAVRLQCARVLLERLAKVPLNASVFVTGDLNSEVTDECVRLILNAGYRDSRALAASPKGPQGSYYDFDLTTVPTKRLDHILVTSTVAIDGYEIINSQRETGRIESDHLPVFVNARIH